MGATAWWLGFLLLAFTHTNNLQLLNIVGFTALIILPGFLTLLVAKIKVAEPWGYLGLTVGVSLLELMLVGLLVDVLLPFAGVAAPLNTEMLFLVFSDLIFVLLALIWKNNKDLEIVIRPRFILFERYRELVLAFAPIIFVIMSIGGAIRLNNGYNGDLTLLMLIGIALYFAVLIRYRKQGGANVIPTALFFISLALLFMTSLRGWYITGHDIQQEYQVFELAKNSGLWSIANFRDPYNACLSITILPTIFYRLLQISDPYVFKILFQIIFAIMPSVLYVTLNKFTSRTTALLSVIYFISFPTFFGDMPMLNRQEVSFLFLALMSYVMFSAQLSLQRGRALFVIFGLGIVVSHYSTTYAIIAILLFLLCSRPCIRKISQHFPKFFSRSGIDGLGSKVGKENRITLTMVVVLAIASFVWSSVLTDTSSGSIVRVFNTTVKIMQSNLKEDAKSRDTGYSLFSGKKIDPNVELKQYNERAVLDTRRTASEGTYYADDIYDKYPVQAAPSDVLPLTELGQAVTADGVNVIYVNYIFRQGSAKILQLLIIIGFIAVIFRKKWLKNNLDMDFMLMAAGSIVLVFSQVILPVLSVEYGLLRAFQQALFFVGIFIVIGSMTITQPLGKKMQKIAVSTLAILFFLSSTGVLTYIIGGYGPQLHLSNSGDYYDTYYLRKTEVTSTEWFVHKMDNVQQDAYQAEIQIDRCPCLLTETARDAGMADDIYPGFIRKDSYVYLGYTNIKKQKGTITYNGDNIDYDYPIDFLDDNKDLIYNNGGSRIYR